MSYPFIDNPINPKHKEPFGKGTKICPKCNGTGSKLNHILMVDIPGTNTGKPKRKLPPGACERCGGTGRIPLIEPIIM